jgi:hypothetical protein
MPPFLGFDAVAAKRGDGLRPELRALFERLATAPSYDVTVRSDGMVQSGPDPAPTKATPSQTQPRRKSNAESATAQSARAACGENHKADITPDMSPRRNN